VQSGPNDQAKHTFTYTCRRILYFLPIYIVDMIPAVRNVDVGVGEGTAKAIARRAAAVQALQYFHTYGIPPP
jgi:hypothetical protein